MKAHGLDYAKELLDKIVATLNPRKGGVRVSHEYPKQK
jgi:hypothetical protein